LPPLAAGAADPVGGVATSGLGGVQADTDSPIVKAIKAVRTVRFELRTLESDFSLVNRSSRSLFIVFFSWTDKNLGFVNNILGLEARSE
jgi:hypothetical protein